MSRVGRGARYSRKRAFLEVVARAVYAGGWAAKVWGALPGRTTVDLVEHRLPLLPVHPMPMPMPMPLPHGAPGVGVAVPSLEKRVLRVAFASDLHIGPLTPSRLLDNAFALLASARPDVLVLGGDYVFLDATPAMARELEHRVAAVPAPVKLAVMGNHDLWTRHDLIEESLRRAGATVLVNQGMRLPPPFDDVAFVGLDDAFTGQPDLEPALRDAGGAPLTIAVAHSPEVLPLVAGKGIPLLMCGHTHGGQIASPRGPILLHGRQGRRYPAGLFQLPDLHLFVSRGLGNVELPVRVFARPDVCLFTLVSPQT
ncbi:MAG: metallophosphoesterase [Myxococcales bacterium]